REDLLRAHAALVAAAKLAHAVRGDAVRERAEGERERVRRFARARLRCIEQHLRPLLPGAAERRREARLRRERARDSERLARFEREQEAARLEVGAAYVVHHAEHDARGPADVGALEEIPRDVLLAALAEADASEPHLA